MPPRQRILIVCTDVMMYLFLLPYVKHLVNKKYHVDIACSSPKGTKMERYEEYIRNNIPVDSQFFHLSSERSPLCLSNIKGYIQICKIIEQGCYHLIWTNGPVLAAITRIAASKYRKEGLKVLYLAHGFHFFKEAPIQNWLYYPIEKIMSHYCDMIVTINWDDYHLTQKYFSKSLKLKHIDGIGLDICKFKNISVNYNVKRYELGVDDDDVLLLSVGELEKHKNHESIIRAVASLNDPRVKYLICGRGKLLEYLKRLSKKLKIDKNILFLGYRHDIGEILKVTDIFVHPSKREGLGIASLEAMATGLPLVTSNIHGIKDYVINGKTGYCLDPNDVNGYAEAIQKLANDPELCKTIGEYNMDAVKKYSLENSILNMETIIQELVEV